MEIINFFKQLVYSFIYFFMLKNRVSTVYILVLINKLQMLRVFFVFISPFHGAVFSCSVTNICYSVTRVKLMQGSHAGGI